MRDLVLYISYLRKIYNFYYSLSIIYFFNKSLLHFNVFHIYISLSFVYNNFFYESCSWYFYEKS